MDVKFFGASILISYRFCYNGKKKAMVLEVKMDLFSTLAKELRSGCPGLEVREYEPMKNHTTLRIGGPARIMVLPRGQAAAVAAVRTAVRLGVRPIYMGNGSNLLVSDQGVCACVIKVLDGLRTLKFDGNGTLSAESGVPLARLANFACKQSLAGLAFAHGIPGTVGGAVTMNAGAYGGEMRQVVLRTQFLTEEGEIAYLRGDAHEFAYRHSAFSDGRRLILNTTFSLTSGDSATIREQMEEWRYRRKSKQPLEWPSAGSTFQRPEGYFAAALIEQCGLKGRQVGGAQVSEKHAGFLVNRENATCADMQKLIELVRETVLRETGVLLELEIKTLGL